MTSPVLGRTIHGSADGEERAAYAISERCGGALDDEEAEEEQEVSDHVRLDWIPCISCLSECRPELSVSLWDRPRALTAASGRTDCAGQGAGPGQG